MSKLRVALGGLLNKVTKILPGIVLCSAIATAALPNGDAQAQTPSSPTRIVLATTDLSGADAEMSRFLTDILITDLAHSTKLLPLERATVQEGIEKLQIGSNTTRSLTAGEIRRLGQTVEANYVLVGAFLVRDDQLIINARVIDASTGLSVPGGAISASGNRRELLQITHRLSKQLHKRLTDTDLLIEDVKPVESTVPVPVIVAPGAGGIGTASGGAYTIVESKAPVAPVVDDFARMKQLGLVPMNARETGVLSDADLVLLIKNIAKLVKPQSDAATVLSQTTGEVTRIRAMAAMVRVMVSAEDVANYRAAPPERLPADYASVPTWGAPYVAAAVDQRWWPADKTVDSKDPANWGFVVQLLVRFPIVPAVEVPAAPARPETLVLDAEPYTGLIIDALDFSVERAMGPRILDEAGNVVYPDPSHVPSDEYVMDHGMVSYYATIPESKRAGKHPLIVRAIKVSDIGHDDFIISNETAALIHEANKRNNFLFRWSVGVLTVKQPVPQPTAPPTTPPVAPPSGTPPVVPPVTPPVTPPVVPPTGTT